ncbi:hypothetical protein LCGC14_1359770 [marine sediment metagenome]|uniref:Uncharacterized protein n=1 Tax=marine sediment metagenome TaxID=412755 RepID=A0A0F9MNT8_9ZZZZ
MKLQNLHEVKYNAPLHGKKSLDNLMKFFIEEQYEDDIRIWSVRDNFVVRNTSEGGDLNQLESIEFAYENETEWKDHVLITYKNGRQDDIPIKDMIQKFEVHETRKVY